MILPAGRLFVAILIAASAGLALPAQDGHPGQDLATISVASVRSWSFANVTRVAVETSAEVRYRVEMLQDPARLVVDIPNSRLNVIGKGIHIVKVGDRLLRQVRLAQNDSTRTRIVLDLEFPVEHEISKLANPHRIMIEVRAAGAKPGETVVSQSRADVRQMESPESKKSEPLLSAPPKSEPVPSSKRAEPLTPPKADAIPTVKIDAPQRKPEQAVASAAGPEIALPEKKPESPVIKLEAAPPRESRPAAGETKTASPANSAVPYARMADTPSRPSTVTPPVSAPKASGPAKGSVRSLTRALGLKLGTVVLDPGHGGYDQGTAGPTGLLEKDLVLEVSQRLGALIEQRLGSKVVYTRSDDSFVSLEERTAIANQNRADLFLSIHANSSPYKGISGADVFYLNFTTSRDALELAARENATQQMSIFELRELVQKIALKEKLDESRDFASKIQVQLASSWSKMSASARNRGVKKAPFVVLIGASMPSVLAEIAFISNPRDEALLKRPDQRQRLAEALFRGIQQYASAFGTTQMARTGNDGNE